jgi:hypothetical protein
LSKVEVYLDEKQIASLKMIINQSQAGVHLLFDNEFISDVFKSQFDEDEFFTVENLIQAQEEIITLIKHKTLSEKKAYIKNLSKDKKTRLVRAYFYIIENEIKQNLKQPH